MRVSIRLAPSALKEVRRALRTALPQVKSSTITECLAYGLGFRNNAVLNAVRRDFPDFGLFIREDFMKRLEELDPQAATEPVPALEDDIIRRIQEHGNELGLVLTDDLPPTKHLILSEPKQFPEEQCRHRVWRQLMTNIINEATRRKLFSLIPGDIRWEPNLKNGDYLMHFSSGGNEIGCTLRDWEDGTIRIQGVIAPNPNMRTLMERGLYDTANAIMMDPQYCVFAQGRLRLNHYSAFMDPVDVTFRYRDFQYLMACDGLHPQRPLGFAPRATSDWVEEFRTEINNKSDPNTGWIALMTFNEYMDHSRRCHTR